ncbi:MAG: hypothetical protein PHO26_10575 [Dehalococcoidia bacterium]|nr:hypothetical protein [Dehalococcoidia bacterium]MDD5495433.1 hypothetical protein [Dehalococcoidia bacterium]
MKQAEAGCKHCGGHSQISALFPEHIVLHMRESLIRRALNVLEDSIHYHR